MVLWWLSSSSLEGRWWCLCLLGWWALCSRPPRARAFVVRHPTGRIVGRPTLGDDGWALAARKPGRNNKNKNNNNNKKKKKQTPNGAAGGGFGSTEREEAAAAPASAAAVEQLNALFAQEADPGIDHPEFLQAESDENADGEADPNSLAPSLLLAGPPEQEKEGGEEASLLESLGLYSRESAEASQNDEDEAEEEAHDTVAESTETVVPDGEATSPLDEAAVLAARFAEEFAAQQESPGNPRQLVKVSESPLVFTIDEFLDPDACRAIGNDAAGCYGLLYPEKLSDDLFAGQESEMDGLLFNAASSVDHEQDTSSSYPDGLHMDTNNRCAHRHVTCILYLNDVPEECGGATVFPLARALPGDPTLEASRRLLDAGISHTRQKFSSKWDPLAADARLLEQRVGTAFPDDPTTQTAIRVQPKAGKLLVFFSRDADGSEDPRAWHAGERILAAPGGRPTEKRILTLFKEVDYENDGTAPPPPDGPLEDYLAPMVAEQRDWLRAKAKLQRALLEQTQPRGGEGSEEA